MDKEIQISKMLKDVHKILSSVHLRKTLYLQPVLSPKCELPLSSSLAYITPNTSQPAPSLGHFVAYVNSETVMIASIPSSRCNSVMWTSELDVLLIITMTTKTC